MITGIIRKPLLTEVESIIQLWLDSNIQAHPFISSDYWMNHIEYMRQVLPLSEVYVCEVKGEIVGFRRTEGRYNFIFDIGLLSKNKELNRIPMKKNY